MRQRRFLGSMIMVLALSIPGMASAQGLILPSAGVINTSMGGASTAAPIDAIGAIYWNPASISGLGRSEVGISSGLVYPSIHASSTLSVPDFKNGGPPRVFSGETRSDSGVAAIPTIGMVYQEPNSDWTFGFGLLAIAGGNVNFPGQQGNPIFTRPLGATW
ncbi:MAG: outer membrane protein transport protein, partial [Gemmataceae bacterium]